MINALLTGAGFVLDSGAHQVAKATNGVTLIFGALISWLVQGNIDAYQEDQLRYEQEVAQRDAELRGDDEDEAEASL